MEYLDPMRIALSGDKARAQSHIREARVIAGSLASLTLGGGASSGRRTRTLPDGTTITVTKAGNDMMVEIDAGGGKAPVEVTIAIVATMVGTTPAIYVVNVDDEVIVDTLTLLTLDGRTINGLCVHPNGRFVYLGVSPTWVVRIDLNERTATGFEVDFSDGGTTTGGSTFYTDLCISPDGERLHYRYTATGIPSGGSSSPTGTYGGYMTVLTADMSIAGAQPNTLFSNRNYYGTVHPVESDLIYFTAYGDADDDDDPNNGSSDPDEVPESIKFARWNGSGTLGGNVVWPFFLASSFGAKEVLITPGGERAYVTNTRYQQFDPDTLVLVPLPTVITYNVEGGTLARVDDLLSGVSITGSIACSHDGATVYVQEPNTGNVLTILHDDSGHSLGPSFSILPEGGGTGDFVGAHQRMHIGPKSRYNPLNDDDRLIVVSTNGQFLTATTPDGEVDKTVLFDTVPGRLAVSRARKFVREDRV